MNTPRPNPAAFDGHWLDRAGMEALLGRRLRWWWQRRPGYDAGRVLRADQARKDKR